jgi:hypothetical protein
MSMDHESSDTLDKLEWRVKDFVPARKYDAYVVVSIEEAIAAAAYNCDSFSGHWQAQRCCDYCRSIGRGDIHRLDRDSDGLACE